jgi:hypothetical protein
MRRASARAAREPLSALWTRLGETAEARWRKANYLESAFPGIAVAVLSGRRPAISGWQILEWCARQSALPGQADPGSQFGDLSLTLFSGARFHLAAYFWLDGSTAIHQHQFSGAFQVLEGSSFHSRYRFSDDRRVSSHLRLGRLELADVELLEAGAVRPIESAGRLIHALFHLDRPSVTLCLRTDADPLSGPQWNYERPGVAVDPFFLDPYSRKLDQALAVVLGAGYREARGWVAGVLERADLETTFRVLGKLFEFRPHTLDQYIPPLRAARDPWPEYVKIARARHGSAVDRLIAALSERERLLDLAQRRGAITRPEHRFFLALLLNIPDRKRVLELVRRRHPRHDPAATIARWVEELSNTKVLGSGEPNVLNVEGAGPEYAAVVAGLFAGRTPARIAADLARQLPDEPKAELRAEVERTIARARRSPVFRAQLG